MDHAEASKEIRRAVDTGSALFGVKETEYSLRKGEGTLLVVSQNTPTLTHENLFHLAQLAQVPVYSFAGNGLELGNVCGKPYVISTLLILDMGKSKAEELGKQTKVKAALEDQAHKTKRGKKKAE
ncbi:MAG: 50S ribosomal protein L30e [archaeon]